MLVCTEKEKLTVYVIDVVDTNLRVEPGFPSPWQLIANTVSERQGLGQPGTDQNKGTGDCPSNRTCPSTTRVLSVHPSNRTCPSTTRALSVQAAFPFCSLLFLLLCLKSLKKKKKKKKHTQG